MLAEVQDERGIGADTQPIWPGPLTDNIDNTWPSMEDENEVRSWVMTHRTVLVRTVTWNLCANPPPAMTDLTETLIPRNRFHVYFIGTEECERSIMRSAINPSKKTWEAYLIDAMGPNYLPLRSHTLQAIANMCSVVTSAAVPTGMGSTLGNKGGVGLHFKIGATRLLVVNAHLAAHQTAERRRNAEFNRINKLIPVLLDKKEAAIAPKSPNRGIGGLFGFGSGAVKPVTGADTPTENNILTNATSMQSVSVESQGELPPVVESDGLLPSVETIVNSAGEIVGEMEYRSGEEHVPVASAVADASEGTAGADNTDAAVGQGGDSTLQSLAPSQVNHNRPDSSARSSPVVMGGGGSPTYGAGSVDEVGSGEVDVNRVNALDGTAILDVPASAVKTLESTADLVVFMGDLNYRIKGNRKIVSSLVANNMHEVLLHNDQLRWNMSQSLVLQGFTEGPLNFRPTYKYDVGTSVYDTSSKGRIPSWTDRILYVPREGVTCTAYCSEDSIQTSDHRPVYASFRVAIQLADGDGTGVAGSASGAGAPRVEGNGGDAAQGEGLHSGKSPEFTSESQVCTIM